MARLATPESRPSTTGPQTEHPASELMRGSKIVRERDRPTARTAGAMRLAPSLCQ